MKMKFLLVALVVLLLPLGSLAQEATPEATADAAEPIVASTETELTEVTTLGPLTISHPQGWSVIEGEDATIVFANLDLVALGAQGADQAFPEQTVIVQLRLFGLNRIEGIEGEPTGTKILTAITSRQTEPEEGEEAPQAPEVTEIEGENYTIARADISSAQGDALAFAYLLTENTFSLVTSTAVTPGVLPEFEATITAILDSAQLQVEAPFAEDVTTRYDAYERSVTEAGFPALGDPDAPITVTEISSFDCPACRNFHAVTLPELLPRVESGEIRFVYIPIYGTGSLPKGDSAARAALCAGTEADLFWEYHDGLFDWHQFGSFAFNYERLITGAQALDIAIDDFNSCYTSEETTATIQAGFDAARNLGEQFQGTPTVLVNGNPVPSNAGAINSAIDLLQSQNNSSD